MAMFFSILLIILFVVFWVFVFFAIYMKLRHRRDVVNELTEYLKEKKAFKITRGILKIIVEIISIAISLFLLLLVIVFWEYIDKEELLSKIIVGLVLLLLPVTLWGIYRRRKRDIAEMSQEREDISKKEKKP